MQREKEYTCLVCDWNGAEPSWMRDSSPAPVCPVCSGAVTRLRTLLNRGEVEELLRW